MITQTFPKFSVVGFLGHFASGQQVFSSFDTSVNNVFEFVVVLNDPQAKTFDVLDLNLLDFVSYQILFLVYWFQIIYLLQRNFCNFLPKASRHRELKATIKPMNFAIFRSLLPERNYICKVTREAFGMTNLFCMYLQPFWPFDKVESYWNQCAGVFCIFALPLIYRYQEICTTFHLNV